MTSPTAEKKSPENQNSEKKSPEKEQSEKQSPESQQCEKKSPENQKNEKKSPAHSVKSAKKFIEPPPPGVAVEPPETFSWLRIFKLADLMMKQGC